jgi:hypothetical protein
MNERGIKNLSRVQAKVFPSIQGRYFPPENKWGWTSMEDPLDMDAFKDLGEGNTSVANTLKESRLLF